MICYDFVYTKKQYFKSQLQEGDLFHAVQGYKIVIDRLQIVSLERTITWNGKIYTGFKTNNLQYISSLNNSNYIRVDIDSPTIGVGDIYKATLCFEPREVEGISWIELELVSVGCSDNRYNTQEILSVCPACNQPVEKRLIWIDNNTHLPYYKYICNNENCIAKQHLLFSRFVAIAMQSPDLVSIILALVNAGYLTSIPQIFTLSPNIVHEIFRTLSKPAVDRILYKINYMKGKVYFCNMLRALPNVDYLNSNCWIQDVHVYRSFLSPKEFINDWLMQLVYSYQRVSFSEEASTDRWVSAFEPEVNKFMSDTLFWGIVEYFKLEEYSPSVAQSQLQQLLDMKVFAPFNCALPCGTSE